MMNSRIHIALALTVLLGASAFAQQETPLVTKTEDQWLQVLNSNAAIKDKADACRELAVVGTHRSVDPLIAMLADEKYNHMARYALETIADPVVNDALRDALPKLKGRPLIGVIGSLGVRRDAAADKVLAAFLNDGESDVVQTAAKSLGRIGTPTAVKALESALPKAAGSSQLAICEGLLRAADQLAATNHRKDAVAIYDLLRALPNAHQQVRAASLRGAILAREQAGVAILIEAIRGNDYVQTAAAARTALEMPMPEVTKALAGELPKLQSADKKILVMQTLSRRGDAAGLDSVLEAAKSGEKTVRVAAVSAIAEFGKGSAVGKLAPLLTDADRDVAKAALETVAALPGLETDAYVIGLLGSENAGLRVAAADLMNRRRMTGSMPALLKAATDKEAAVRSAAVRNAGELAQPSDLAALLDLFVSTKSADQLEPVSQALITTCTRFKTPDQCADALTARRDGLNPAQQSALLRVLGRVAGPKALQAVRDAVANTNPEIHAAALRSLASWDNTDAAPALLETVKTGSAADRATAFEGFLRLCSESDAPADQRFQLISQIADQARDPQEKKQFLTELGGIQNVAALQLAAKYCGDEQLTDVAGAAVVKICAKLDASKKPEMAPVLKQVAKSAKDKAVVDQASKLMQKLGIAAE